MVNYLNMNVEVQYYKSPVGELIIGTYNNQLCLCDWKYRKMRTSVDKRIQKGLNASYVESSNLIIDTTIRQLSAYFEGKLTQFEIPLLMVGTEFQRKVWNALIQIPFGKTASYLQLSRDLGNEKAIRAVATANGANAISILVPCHRIIGSDGSLVGYAGGLSTKKKLLSIENSLQAEQLSLF